MTLDRNVDENSTSILTVNKARHTWKIGKWGSVIQLSIAEGSNQPSLP